MFYGAIDSLVFTALIRQPLTVSTQHNMSRKNFEDAPNALMTGTPAIVSPYIE